MLSYREPLYPLFLSFFRYIFSSNNYLYYAVLSQSILTAYCVYSFSTYICDNYEIRSLHKLLITSIILFVSLIPKIGRVKSFMYSNMIMSEGIAFPLFLLFFKYLLRWSNEQKIKDLLMASLISVLLILTRKQMYLTVCLLVCSFIFLVIKNKNYKKLIIQMLVTVAIIVASSKCVDYIYMKNVNAINTTHTGDSRFVAAMVIYCSEKEDYQAIEDKNIRNLFLDIYEECDIQGYLKHSAQGNWYERFTHFARYFDKIQIYTAWEKTKEYSRSTYGLEGYNVDIKADEINTYFIRELIPEVASKMLSTIIDNILVGLLITVSGYRKKFIIYAITVYVLYICLLICLTKKKMINSQCIFFCSIILISVLLNVTIVAIGVFNQRRYTMYNMPLFYIGGLLMVTNLISQKNKHTNILKV